MTALLRQRAEMLLALLVMVGGLVVAGLTASSAAVGLDRSGGTQPSTSQEHVAIAPADGE